MEQCSDHMEQVCSGKVGSSQDQIILVCPYNTMRPGQLTLLVYFGTKRPCSVIRLGRFILQEDIQLVGRGAVLDPDIPIDIMHDVEDRKDFVETVLVLYRGDGAGY